MTAFGMILLFAFFTVHVLLDMTFFSLKKYCLKKYLYIIIVWYVWYVEINAMSKFTPITHQPSGQVSDSGCELQCEIATCIQVQY